MRKIVIFTIVISISALLLALLIQNNKNYDEEWIIGKTCEQVAEKYGAFEWYISEKDANQQILYYVGMYEIKPEQIGFLGTKQATYFCIKFGMDHIAFECYEETGGRGG